MSNTDKELALEACAALATVHYDHLGKVCGDVERCFAAAKALYAALYDRVGGEEALTVIRENGNDLTNGN